MDARYDHQRLDVYRAAVEFGVWARRLVRRLPPGNGDLVDQLCRAAASIALNIAEGCGEFSTADRLRFYRIARRSATECSAILDLIAGSELLLDAALEDGRGLLSRITAMLTGMLRQRPVPNRRARG